MDQEALLKKQRYPRQGSVVFLRVNEANGELSNMNGKFPLRVNGIDIRTSEALYQACRFPGYPEAQRLIIEAKGPMATKMASKPHRKDKCRADWEQAHVDVMRWCLRVKLAQHMDAFGGLLWMTEKRPIIEESSKRDDYWGPAHRKAYSAGIERAGEVADGTSRRVQQRGSESVETVQPLSIPDFRLMGEEIGVVG